MCLCIFFSADPIKSCNRSKGERSVLDELTRLISPSVLDGCVEQQLAEAPTTPSVKQPLLTGFTPVVLSDAPQSEANRGEESNQEYVLKPIFHGVTAELDCYQRM